MTPISRLVVSTALTGVGLGLMTWLGFGLGGHNALFGWAAAPLVFAAALGGLALSPRRPKPPADAAEAAETFRGSWAGREGLLTLAALLLFAVYALPWLLLGWRIGPLGLAVAVVAAGALVAGGMGWRTAPDAPRWNTPLTPALFLLFGLASGALADAMITDIASPDDGGRADGAAVFLLLMAFALRFGWYERARKLEAPAAGEPPAPPFGFSTKTLRQLALALAIGVPVICIDLSGRYGALFVLIGLGAHLAGLLTERWLFLTAEPKALAARMGETADPA